MYNAGVESFLVVARTLNISRAAEQLNLAQSTISKRLKDLEDEIGAVLIERGQGVKNLRLTTAGEEFLSIALRWSALRIEALDLNSDKHRFSLSIGSLDSLNFALFPPLYHALSRHQPKLKLSVTTTHSPELYDLVDHNQVDVAFSLLERTHPTVVVEKCYSEPMVVLRLGSQTHPEPKAIHPRELDPDHELFLVSGLSYKVWHDYWWDPLCTNCIRLDNAQLVFSFLSDEQQWAIIPMSVAKMAKNRGNFSMFPLLEGPPDRIVYKLTRKHPKASTLASLKVLDHYLSLCLPQK